MFIPNSALIRLILKFAQKTIIHISAASITCCSFYSSCAQQLPDEPLQNCFTPSNGRIIQDQVSAQYLPAEINISYIKDYTDYKNQQEASGQTQDDTGFNFSNFPKSRYPLVVVFSPYAEAYDYLLFWTCLADKYKFIVYSSKLYRNNLNQHALENITQKTHSSLINFIKNFPVNQKIIFTGHSGGGSYSHYLNNVHPNIAYGLLINTGRMWEDSTLKNILEDIEKTKSLYTRPLKVGMSASPTDFRFTEMKRDRIVMHRLGWEINWVEFKGGHNVAPYDVYEQQLKFLLFSKPVEIMKILSLNNKKKRGYFALKEIYTILGIITSRY